MVHGGCRLQVQALTSFKSSLYNPNSLQTSGYPESKSHSWPTPLCMAIISSSQRIKTSLTHNLKTQVLSIQYFHNPPPQPPNHEFQTSPQPWTTAHHLRTSCSGPWELHSSETGSFFPTFAPPWLWGTNFLNQPPPSAPQGQSAH